MAAFHQGDAAAMERCYREHFDAVDAAIGTMLGGADRETVIHEVFWRLLASTELRRSFHGGSMAAWLATIARHHAIDYRRRLSREVALPADGDRQAVPTLENEAETRILLEQFQREGLRPAWRAVFELRFLRQMSQREAAAALRINRTTLAYRELRIRQEFRRFLLEDEE